MKPLLMAVYGLGLALVMFLSGLIAATAFFNAEPEQQLSLATESTEVWTHHPVKVNKSAQAFDRLAARPVPRQSQNQSASPGVMPAVESTSVEVESNSQPPLQAETIAAHLAWCSDRYRSYRAYDNSYTPYRGGRRECVSPYFGPTDPGDSFDRDQVTYRPSGGPLELVYADHQSYVGTDHVEYCFSRYRSYRSEDNTYQPYDGGPRRQCR